MFLSAAEFTYDRGKLHEFGSFMENETVEEEPEVLEGIFIMSIQVELVTTLVLSLCP